MITIREKNEWKILFIHASQSTGSVFLRVSQPKLPELMTKRRKKYSMNECMNEYVNERVFFETEQDTKRKREKIEKL
jgi:hypothetical protein